MALGDLATFSTDIHHRSIGEISRPTQIESRWATLIAAGGLNIYDSSGNDITDPTREIVNSTRHIHRTGHRGGSLCLRMAYDDAMSVPTAPVVQVFGRTSTTEAWMRLENNAGSINITIATNAADISSAPSKYTTPNIDDQVVPLKGCFEFLIGVKTKHAAISGDVDVAYLQGKLLQ